MYGFKLAALYICTPMTMMAHTAGRVQCFLLAYTANVLPTPRFTYNPLIVFKQYIFYTKTSLLIFLFGSFIRDHAILGYTGGHAAAVQ